MRLIVTGSRELEYSVPFTIEADQERMRVMRKMGEKPSAATVADVALTARNYARTLVLQEVHRILDTLAARQQNEGDPITCLVHGGAPGVDRYAASWAVAHDIPQIVYKPKWMKHGVLDKAAGFKRNWYMLFQEAGKQVAADLNRESGKLAQKQRHILRLIAKAKKHPNAARWLHVLVPLRVVLEDSRHPARRSVMRRLGVAVPEGVIVAAFHDTESRGTAHCMMAASQLGYIVTRFDFPKPEKPAIETGRINHRPDLIYHEVGEGRAFS